MFTGLINAANRNRCAIVLVGHQNKNEGQKDIYRGFGTADIAASVRSVLRVGIDPEDRSCRILTTIKSNFDESWGEPVRFTLDHNRRLVWLTPDDFIMPEKAISKRQTAKELLLSLLADGPMASTEITRKMIDAGISEKTLERAKKEVPHRSFVKDRKTYIELAGVSSNSTVVNQ